ncbi:MAG: hypothetical protein WD009_01455 [Phycisphaeraceae bacterium]
MSQFNASGYEVPRTSGQCAATGRPLEPGEAYYATLVDVEPGADDADATTASALGMARVDVSLAAWEQGYRPPRLFSYWKTTVPQPNEKKKLFVDDAVLLNLLHRLADAEEPDRLAFRYVLALILMRKRLLRFDRAERRDAEVDGQKAEQEWWLLTPKKDPSKGPLGKWDDAQHLELLDPRLDEERIEQVTRQLGEILEAEL